MKQLIFNLLFINSKTGKISHSKFWSNVCYVVLIWAFIHSIMYGQLAGEIIWLVFCAAGVGNYTAQLLLKERLSPRLPQEPESLPIDLNSKSDSRE